MFLSDLCIRRPVFTTMLILSLVVLGMASYRELGLDLFPKIDIPTVAVSTTLEGASPEEIETQITKPIEEVVNTINGIDELSSISSEGISRVVARFVLEKDPEVAANDVRDKVGTILSKFPKGTDPPIIEKFDPDAAPVLAIVVSGPQGLREITEIADKKIKQPLETIKGVGSISLVGDRKREIQVYIDPGRLAAYGLTIHDVKRALQTQNVEIPGGRVTYGQSEKVLRTMGRVSRARDFNQVIVAYVKGVPIKVSDLGYVVDGEEEPRTLSRLNGENAVSMLVRKQSGTNTVKVVDAVKARLREIERELPPGVKVQTTRDQSRFIRRSFEEVQTHLILGGFLASLVVLLFIRNPRSALIAAISIPTSIVSSFTLMRYLGFTLNSMTMLALSLSTGIVIDDAIVVLENIYRYIEEKDYAPMEAARAATKEIGLAVMATTLSLVVIFLPVAFMSGIVGRFFYQFGITAATAIMVSLLVAFTLTPMLCSRILKARTGGHRTSKESRFYRLIDRGYGGILKWSLRHRLAVMFLALLTVLSVGYLFPRVGKELIVQDDMSEFEVIVEAPEGSSLERTDRIMRGIEEEVGKLKGVTTLFTTIGAGDPPRVGDTSLYVGLNPLREGNEFQRLLQHIGLRRLFGFPALREREFSQQDVMRVARVLLAKYPELKTSVQNISAIRGGGYRQTLFNMSLRGPDLARLQRYSEELVREGKEIPGMVDVDSTLARRNPEVRVHINREKAADLGVIVEAMASSLRTMVGGEEVTKFKEGDEQYGVRLRLQQDFRRNASVISQLYVPSNRVGLVKLNNLVSFTEEKGPAQIERFDRERQVSIVANLEKGFPLGTAVAKMNAKVSELDLPSGYSTKYLGQAKVMQEAVVNFLIALVLSLIFIYMVLASQFESFVHPITIMTALPLSLPFALIALLATGKTLNVYSTIGVFLLMGVVKKNTILQVDFTNTLREKGMPRYEAIIEANRARLRPILMTTLAIIAGMLPIAFGKGDGSASRASMATVVAGGQALCLLLTLIVAPVIYSLLDDLKQFRLGYVFELGLIRWVGERLSQGYSKIANSRIFSGNPRK